MDAGGLSSHGKKRGGLFVSNAPIASKDNWSSAQQV
jgi:hypothetical protein